jgi:pimeloyl-ACP methyl ester carboxylesterase
VIAMDREAFDAMDETVRNLGKKALLPGAGHRIQQERRAQVNQWLLEFLATL